MGKKSYAFNFRERGFREWCAYHKTSTSFRFREWFLPHSIVECQREYMEDYRVLKGRRFFDRGSSGNMEMTKAGHVRKCPEYRYPDLDTEFLIEHEYAMYQRIGPHPRLVHIFGYNPKRVEITMEYMEHGSLKRYMEKHSNSFSDEQRRRWIADVLESVQFLHSRQVIHGDINYFNFLVDRELRLRIIDFGGSSTFAEPAGTVENTRHAIPRVFYGPGSRDYHTQGSVKSDLFSIGSTIYEIVTGSLPYADLTDDEVEALYADGKFPTTDGLMCARMIEACWTSKVSSIDELMTMFDTEPALEDRPLETSD